MKKFIIMLVMVITIFTNLPSQFIFNLDECQETRVIEENPGGN